MKIIRRIFSGTLCAIAACMPSAAQNAVGSWQLFNNFTTTTSHLIDTPHIVYGVSDGNLFSYDKDSDEIFGYTTLNYLSDNVITDIRRNYDKNYIVIFYQSGNIDILYDDGTVNNLPDILDTQSVSSKTIYDVAFDGDMMYVATGFGLVQYNVSKAAVKDAGIYNRPVYGVTIIGDQIMLIVDDTVYTFARGERFSTLTNLSPVGHTDMRQIETLSDNLVIGSQRGSSTWFGVYRFDPQANTITELWRENMPQHKTPVRFDDGYMVSNPYGFFIIRPNATSSTGFDRPYYSFPAEYRFRDNVTFCGGYTSGNRFWYSNGCGFGQLTHDGSFKNFKTDTGNAIRPFGTNIDNGVAGITPGSRGLYLYNRASSRYPRYDFPEERMCINLLDNGFITDITPTDIISRVNRAKGGGTSQRVIEDPSDPSVIYFGSWFEGLHVNRNGSDITKFDWRNTPADSTWCHIPFEFALDQSNNLWLCTITLNGIKLMVLPADKRMRTDVKASDWTLINLGTLATDSRTRNFRILPLRKPQNRNLVVFADGFDPNNFAILNTGGNVTSTSGHKSRVTSYFTDQDGKTFGPPTIISLAEDQNGSVWAGTTSGVFAIHNPGAFITSSNPTVERIKVPRNDGTSLADYLLDNQVVTDIAVDGANRKWLATDASGVYLVSPDGREILQNFNTSNSPLPSNNIRAVVCDPDGNKVYFATAAGLACYTSTAAPAEDSYDNVYAYPNPVRPDYNGWISITGLMDDSLVKIADTSGNILFQTKSSGGMVTWNGCNTSGQRVRSGVYYVFASTGGDSSSGKVVTKILVIN